MSTTQHLPTHIEVDEIAPGTFRAELWIDGRMVSTCDVATTKIATVVDALLAAKTVR